MHKAKPKENLLFEYFSKLNDKKMNAGNRLKVLGFIHMKKQKLLKKFKFERVEDDKT
jgi:hypothetical protein